MKATLWAFSLLAFLFLGNNAYAELPERCRSIAEVKMTFVGTFVANADHPHGVVGKEPPTLARFKLTNQGKEKIVLYGQHTHEGFEILYPSAELQYQQKQGGWKPVFLILGTFQSPEELYVVAGEETEVLFNTYRGEEGIKYPANFRVLILRDPGCVVSESFKLSDESPSK